MFGGSLPNHTLARPFNVVGKILHIISSRTPWRCMVVLNVAMWSQGSCVPSYESKVGILSLEGGGWLVMDAMRGGTNPVDKVIHMICSPHGIFHLFHGSFHLVHLPFQMWYLISNGSFGLVFFSIILNPFILWIPASFFTTSLFTLSINFSS